MFGTVKITVILYNLKGLWPFEFEVWIGQYGAER